MDELEKSLIAIQHIRKDLPDIVNSYLNYTSKIKSSGNIDGKNKALILVSLSLYAQCEMCIAMNVAEALEAGASKDEILESAMLAVSMGGGPKMMFIKYIYEALEV
jgi:AhpD family alkylhydroperoxidase